MCARKRRCSAGGTTIATLRSRSLAWLGCQATKVIMSIAGHVSRAMLSVPQSVLWMPGPKCCPIMPARNGTWSGPRGSMASTSPPPRSSRNALALRQGIGRDQRSGAGMQPCQPRLIRESSVLSPPTVVPVRPERVILSRQSRNVPFPAK